MSESIVWLDQAEACDVQLCGVKVADLTRRGAERVGFAISATAIAQTQRNGKVDDELAANILHAYHRLIVFGGVYMPFVEISASPLTAESNGTIAITPQIGGNTVIATIEEMVQTTPDTLFAVLVQPSNQFAAE